MEFSVDKHEKYVVIRLDERKFTNFNSPGLKAEFILLNTEGYANIVLDLSEVRECTDSQDLSCLLVADRLCKKDKGLFIITGVADCITKILNLSAIDQSLHILGSVAEAEDLIFMEEIEKELLGSFDEEQ